MKIRYTRLTVFLTITLLLLSLLATSAWAEGTGPAIDSVEVNGKEVAKGGKVYINKNLVDIVVDSSDATSVEIGKVSKSEDDDFEFLVYLKSGSNKITIKATSSTGDTTWEIEVVYTSGAEYGASYVIDQYPLSGDVSVFEGDIKLDFPKSTYITYYSVSSSTYDAAEKQSVEFSVYNITQEIKNSSATEPPNISNGYLVSKAIKVSPYPAPSTSESKNYAMSGSGSIVLKYDENINKEAAKSLTIYYKPLNENCWYNLGGILDTSGHRLKASFRGFGEYAVMNMPSYFLDYDEADTSKTEDTIEKVQWSRIYVEPLWARGLFGEPTEGMLGLYDNITRGDLAKMLVKGMSLELADESEEPNNFHYGSNEISGPDIFTKRYILTAVKYGLMLGNKAEDNKVYFSYEKNLQRQEAALIFARALGLKMEEDKDKAKTQIDKLCSKDIEAKKSPSPWAWPAIIAVSKAKFMVGYTTGEFGSQDPLTKEQSSKLIYLLMKNLKKI